MAFLRFFRCSSGVRIVRRSCLNQESREVQKLYKWRNCLLSRMQNTLAIIRFLLPPTFHPLDKNASMSELVIDGEWFTAQGARLIAHGLWLMP